jgi:hypothetical protein
MAGRFEVQLRNFRGKTMDQVDQVRRASVLELFKLIIYATPVDTGRLRGNWQTTINSPARGTKDRVDPSGAAAMAEAIANLGGLADAVWFVNNLPYVERIEYDGWSRQAPEGMVRRHLAQWRRIVNAKAKAVGK